ncbi:MAG: hypothetical protein J0H59_10145 [Comamonadaceae bacterium]|jgi:hypothetical protein|nr:hypothetical protein [Comamonadaceae bacterium]
MKTVETIQSELNEIYGKFKKETNLPLYLAKRASPPLLLSVPEKWVNSPKRILIIGQETLGWAFDPSDYFPGLKTSIMSFSDFLSTPDSVNAMVAGYRDFEFARHQHENYNSPFWRTYRTIRRALGEDEDGSETTVLWTNLFKMSLDGGSVVHNGTTEETLTLRDAGTASLHAEIKALAPTGVIFFTGPNYNEHLYAQFPRINLRDFVGHNPEKTAKLEHPLLPACTFRTYHPGYLARSGQMGIIPEIISQII